VRRSGNPGSDVDASSDVDARGDVDAHAYGDSHTDRHAEWSIDART
jgi:hypothetical protein